MEIDDDTLAQQCSAAVDLLLARHKWQLLERGEFVRRAVESLRSGVAADPQRAAVGVYSQALYTACSGNEGTVRQLLGYTELSRYFHDIAYRRYPQVRDDVAQSALVRIFAAFSNCRKPVAFLAFALQHLRDAARAALRQEQMRLPSLDATLGDDENTLGMLLADQQLTPLAQVLADEQRVLLNQAAEAFMRAHPRATQQFAALWLKHIDGLDDAAISAKLGVPVNSVYVLRSRVIRKLRSDPRWRVLAIEFGLLPEEEE